MQRWDEGNQRRAEFNNRRGILYREDPGHAARNQRAAFLAAALALILLAVGTVAALASDNPRYLWPAILAGLIVQAAVALVRNRWDRQRLKASN